MVLNFNSKWRGRPQKIMCEKCGQIIGLCTECAPDHKSFVAFYACIPTKHFQAFILLTPCPANLVHLVLINLLIFIGVYKSRSSSLCCFLHHPVTHFLPSGPADCIWHAFSNFSMLHIRTTNLIDTCSENQNTFRNSNSFIRRLFYTVY